MILKIMNSSPTIFSYNIEEINKKLENLNLTDDDIKNMIRFKPFASSDYEGDQNKRKK